MNITDIILARKLSGGGGSLPTPSAQNVGAALVVKKVVSQGAVIVPEQMVVVDGSFVVLSNTDQSLFTVGTNVIAIINGTEYASIVMQGDDGVYVSIADELYTFDIYDGNTEFVSDEAGTYTIALYVASVSYGYGLEEYVGYDVVIGATALDNTLSHYTPIKWDYPYILNKVRNGEMISGVLFSHYNYDIAVSGDTDNTPLYLARVMINSGTGEIYFYGNTAGFKPYITIAFDFATGEFISVTKSEWS